jgi:hypothetical protein
MQREGASYMGKDGRIMKMNTTLLNCWSGHAWSLTLFSLASSWGKYVAAHLGAGEENLPFSNTKLNDFTQAVVAV